MTQSFMAWNFPFVASYCTQNVLGSGTFWVLDFGFWVRNAQPVPLSLDVGGSQI
jgi:hypothetical protein